MNINKGKEWWMGASHFQMELANIAKCLLLGVVILWIQIHGNKGCFEEERLALLDFKAFVGSNGFDADYLLPSWIDDPTCNCCKWERVLCNSTTGHVTELSLNNTRQYDIESLSFYIDENSWYVNLSMFQQLKQLKTLNLSYNHFDCSIDDQGCESLSKLKKLEVLDLTWNRFNNIILPSLGALISLKNLILGSNSMEGSFPIQELKNLKNLTFLDISDNNFNGALLFKGLCGLKSLVELDLQGNQFSGPLPECIGNLTNLQFLDLSFNQLSGNIQSIVSELTSLKYLLLSGNEFEGSFSFSALANHSKLEAFMLSPGNSRLEVETENPTWFPAFQLKYIRLSNCSLNVRTRAIPSFLHYQYDIRFIDLSHNTLVGTFPTWILQNNSKLVVMNLGNNSFTGTFQLPNFKHDLVQLDISSNNLTGMLPKEFGLVLPRLVYINMSRNNFGGNVPSSISETPALSILDLSHNNFSGELPGSLFANCTMYCALFLSNNNFQGNVFPQDMDLRSMTVLDMKNNNFSAMVDADLLNSRSLSSLNFFDISNNKVSGPIPRLLCNLTYLVFLDLSKNRLYGSMPSCFDSSLLRFLFLQKNNLSGPIPHELLRSPNLWALDLRDNNFSGNIPSWIGQFSELQVLLLGGNALHGRIPNQLCELRNANIMDLSRNLLFGSVPSCFSNISFGNNISFGTMEVVDFPNFVIIYLNNPDLNLHLPWVEWDYSELVEVEFATKYRYNSYKGDIINSMAGIDLSCNELSGSIPQEIGDLHEIRSLNLSHNHITGSIPVSFSNLRSLESLDLGNNNLSGEIPSELVALTFLGTFNVSYNNLSGRVPNGAQFGTFDENNYRGNPGLCGERIHKSCKSDEAPQTPPPSADVEEEDEGVIDMVWFYWSFSGAYVTILLVLTAILRINKHWRMLWFYYVDVCIYSISIWNLDSKDDGEILKRLAILGTSLIVVDVNKGLEPTICLNFNISMQ
ncbi:receptor-like protein 56 [Manihot esculenta]|uniref:receptor-like protein 56 n=1 Tax=Manihot esculenta TaxID=3983 RepID=UPI001CC6D9FA|nr:receptor-like protein 56 [Manihot esculenta]